jgi:hypothetical protein
MGQVMRQRETLCVTQKIGNKNLPFVYPLRWRNPSPFAQGCYKEMSMKISKDVNVNHETNCKDKIEIEIETILPVSFHFLSDKKNLIKDFILPRFEIHL